MAAYTQARATGEGVGNRWRRALMAVCGAMLVLSGAVFLASRYERHQVGTEVMGPALDGDHIALVDRAYEKGEGIGHGDVVTIRGGWPDAPADHVYTLRVIGLAGDKVAVSAQGGLSVNGRQLSEPYAHGDNLTYGAFNVTVPEDRVFLLGDARSVAVDSRAYLGADAGTLPVGHIQGRVGGSAWPVWRLGADPGAAHRFPAHVIASATTVIGGVLVLYAGWPLLRAVTDRARRIRRPSADTVPRT
ncbi:signal peptidase I [Streptomyces sp. NPDC003077]|uniref:signal peptidase I n=1 Tax=Streptomyces sp. NPDC003077 TaxID=3154443 RepID=UPI0033B8779C